MKRPLLIIFIVVVIALIVGGAERVLEKTLDRQLPPLLTDELGLPVTLSPIKADILSLTARADHLQMDGENEPALVAETVMVSLNWSDLLRGEIRLVTASAEDLMVKIAAWPSDDDPLPPDYYFLDQWLPKSIDLAKGRYVSEDSNPWPIHSAKWRRDKGGGASLSWQEDRPAGAFDAEFKLDSLHDLLGLKLFQGELSLETNSDALPPTSLSVKIEPGGQGQAYRLQAQGHQSDTKATLEADGFEAWSWPESSTTHFDTLYADRLVEFIRLFVADGVEDDLEKELQSELPALELPIHQGKISVGEFRLGREMTHNNVINFNSSGRHLAVTQVIMKGPYGDLEGSAAVVSTKDGWETALAADVRAQKTDQGLISRYVDSHWYVKRGIVRLKGRGNNWGALIDSMTGEFDLSGAHRGQQEVPVSLKAKLDGSPREFALEQIDLQLGDSSTSGSVAFAGGRDRQLSFKLRSDQLDLRFLFDEPGTDPQPGIVVPEVLALFPGIEVSWDVHVEELTLPNFRIGQFALEMNRSSQLGRFVLSGKGASGGDIKLTLNYETQKPQPTRVVMRLEMSKVDVNQMFGITQGVLESRTSGTIEFTSQGNSVSEVFHQMRGDADLKFDFRNDANWQRESRPEERLGATGLATLIIKNERILGINMDKLSIDSIEQDVSGSASIAAGRDKFFIAELRSDHLNLSRVLGWLPDSTEDADQTDILQILRDLGPGEIGFRIGELVWLKDPVTDVTIDFSSSTNRFDLQHFDFTYLGAKLNSKASLSFQGDVASLDAKGAVSALVLDDFVDAAGALHDSRPGEPLAGNFNIDSQGSSVSELFAGASGKVKLKAASPSTNAIDIDLKHIDNGVEVAVNSFIWADSDLKGRLVYQDTAPRNLQVELAGGTLDLRPWEEEYFAKEPQANQKKDEKETALVKKTAEKTGRFALDFLSYPARMVRGDGKATPPGERIFSSEPLDLSSFQSIKLHVHGRLDQLHSAVADARNMTFDARLTGGQLSVTTTVDAINGGTLGIDGTFDSNALPPSADLDMHFRGLFMDPEKSTYPRDGHVIVNSTGGSEAELAGNLNGMGYLEFGRGPIDYRGLAILTADAATSMFRRLIPGAATRQPELQCGITLAQFTDGKGITPYGWAARTRTANLLGAIEVDMKEEQLQLRFRSRSREGVGISIGNAFSNSVSIAGPLSHPRIVPNTPGLFVRGWAAFLTAGLSVVGESFYNRVLASGNPCDSIRQAIRKDLCKTDAPLAASPIACPTATDAAPAASIPDQNPGTTQ